MKSERQLWFGIPDLRSKHHAAEFGLAMNRNPLAQIMALGAATVIGVGQIPLSSLTSGFYTQNFDTLAATGTGIAWTDNSTLAGWYLSRLTYDTGTGSSSTGSAYSFGQPGSSDRALGSVASGLTGQIIYGLRFRNDTTETFTGFNIDYVGEQWRRANNANFHSLQFSYKISASPITSLVGADFSSVTQLDFIGPAAGATTATALNGNLAANRDDLSFNLIFGQPLDPGEEIMFRWIDVDDGNADHGLAIDNLSIEIPEAKATAPVAAAVGVGIVLAARRRKNR